MTIFSHNIYLVAASLAVAMMAGFTGLSITRGASLVGYRMRKVLVAMSAVVLGSGIWAMHFVAMLGMRLPTPFYYDALTTMVSALVAILMTGIALLLVHFGTRTRFRILLSGAVLAAGILTMHYIGMSGIQLYTPVYSFSGVFVAVILALVLCEISFGICYGHRSDSNIIYGTIGFGLTVFITHFVAIAGTRFVRVEGVPLTPLAMSNEVLAIGVALTSFVLSGAFLLTSVTFKARLVSGHSTSPPLVGAPDLDEKTGAPGQVSVMRIPYEQNGETRFIAADQVAAIGAEGRYTCLYNGDGQLFSPRSISKAERVLATEGFVRCHRGYLINLSFVESFERKKDTGICHLKGISSLATVPVSRSCLGQVRKALGV